MHSFRGRRISQNGETYDWYMNPEGKAFRNANTEKVYKTNSAIRQGFYNGEYAVYQNVPVGYSLADELLFHPEVDHHLIDRYQLALNFSMISAVDSSTWSAECDLRVMQFLKNQSTLKTYQHSALFFMQKKLETTPHLVEYGSVAVGIGRILMFNNKAVLLAPFGNTPSKCANLARIAEETQMIATLFKEKRPQAAKVASIIASNFLSLGTQMYPKTFNHCLFASLAAHIVRRMQAPHVPPEFVGMMNQVATDILAKIGISTAS